MFFFFFLEHILGEISDGNNFAMTLKVIISFLSFKYALSPIIRMAEEKLS